MALFCSVYGVYKIVDIPRILIACKFMTVRTFWHFPPQLVTCTSLVSNPV